MVRRALPAWHGTRSHVGEMGGTDALARESGLVRRDPGKQPRRGRASWDWHRRIGRGGATERKSGGVGWWMNMAWPWRARSSNILKTI